MDNLTSPAAKNARYLADLAAIQNAGGAVRSYKVGVLTRGDRDWVFNGIRHATPEEARQAADSIAWRWTAVQDTIVLPSADAPLS